MTEHSTTSAIKDKDSLSMYQNHAPAPDQWKPSVSSVTMEGVSTINVLQPKKGTYIQRIMDSMYSRTLAAIANTYNACTQLLYDKIMHHFIDDLSFRKTFITTMSTWV